MWRVATRLPGASPDKSLAVAVVFNFRNCRFLPWAFSLSGVAIHRLDRPFDPSPPLRLAVAAVTRCSGACGLEFRSTMNLPDLVGRAPLLGFCASTSLA